MAKQLKEIEGMWEEIAARGDEFAGQRVKLILLGEDAEDPYPGVPPEERPSTAGSLLKYAGTWEGDDLKECLEEVVRNRTKAKF